MIRLALKNLWARKRRNAWLMAELIVVSIVLWHFADPVTVQTYVNMLPDGFTSENLYRISIQEYDPSSYRYLGIVSGIIPEWNRLHFRLEEAVRVVGRTVRHQFRLLKIFQCIIYKLISFPKVIILPLSAIRRPEDLQQSRWTG